MWGLKSTVKIMETRFKWWHPSSRHDKNAGFSVSWIFVFLSGRGIQRRRQERELHNAHWNIWNLFFSLSSSRTKNISQITGKPRSSLSPMFQTKKWTFLKLCGLFWVILLQSMSNFSETGHPSFACGCSLTLPSPLLDFIPRAAAASSSIPTATCTWICSSA